MSLQTSRPCVTVNASGGASLGRPRSQGAHRWVVPARRGRPVGSPPLAFLGLLVLVLGCADDEEANVCVELERCEVLRTECASDSIIAWCDGEPPCVLRCVDVCADLGARWSGECHVSAELGREVCSCQ